MEAMGRNLTLKTEERDKNLTPLKFQKNQSLEVKQIQLADNLE